MQGPGKIFLQGMFETLMNCCPFVITFFTFKHHEFHVLRFMLFFFPNGLAAVWGPFPGVYILFGNKCHAFLDVMASLDLG